MDLLLAVLERVYTYSERYSWSVMSVTGTAGENKGRETQKACLLKLSGNEAWRDECRLGGKVFTFWSARSNHGQTLGKVSSPFASLFPNLRQYER